MEVERTIKRERWRQRELRWPQPGPLVRVPLSPDLGTTVGQQLCGGGGVYFGRAPPTRRRAGCRRRGGWWLRRSRAHIFRGKRFHAGGPASAPCTSFCLEAPSYPHPSCKLIPSSRAAVTSSMKPPASLLALSSPHTSALSVLPSPGQRHGGGSGRVLPCAQAQRPSVSDMPGFHPPSPSSSVAGATSSRLPTSKPGRGVRVCDMATVAPALSG